MSTVAGIRLAMHGTQRLCNYLKNPKPDPNRDIGRTRDVFEKASGGVAAVLRTPANVISGTIVGGIQGFRRGGKAEVKLGAVGSATGQVALNTAAGQTYAGVTGFLVGGPVGMLAGMAYDAANAIPGIYVCVRNESAKQMGAKLSEAIEGSVNPGDGRFMGLLKGMGTGFGSSRDAALETGFQEGKGSASGLWDAAFSGAKKIAKRDRLQGNLLSKAGRAVGGVAMAATSLPAGIVVGILGKEPRGKLARAGLAFTSGAAAGAAAGIALGPVGAAVGAIAGGIVGAAGPARKSEFGQQVSTEVNNSVDSADNLGSKVANNNQNMVVKIVNGAVSGAVEGWNFAV